MGARELNAEEVAEKGLTKYYFLEDFPRKKSTNAWDEKDAAVESPKVVKTELYGERLLHRIARVRWKESAVEKLRRGVDLNGNPTEETQTEYFYEIEVGEVGGWVEAYSNLSRTGKCWVEKGGIVVGSAEVSAGATIGSGAEVGDFAKVSGEAKVSGPAGIGGECVVTGKAEIVGRLKDGVKTFVVRDTAHVEGKVSEGAEVYGAAVVCEGAEVCGESEVFGNARLGKGAKVSGKSKVFGWAQVCGGVGNYAIVYGCAAVGEHGSIEGVEDDGKPSYSRVSVGTIDGRMVATSYTEPGGILDVEEGASVERCTIDAGIHRIGKDCILQMCRLRGFTDLEETTARGFVLEDSIVKKSTLEDPQWEDGAWSSVVRSVVEDATIDGNSLETTITDSVVSDSHLEHSERKQWVIDGSVKVPDGYSIEESAPLHGRTVVTGGVVPKDSHWKNVSMSGISNIRLASGLNLSGISKVTDAVSTEFLQPTKPEPLFYTYAYANDDGSETSITASYSVQTNNYGTESYGDITEYSDNTERKQLEAMLEGKEEEERLSKEEEAKVKERTDYLEEVDNQLLERDDAIASRRQSIIAAMDAIRNTDYDDESFPNEVWDGYVRQLDELANRSSLISIARAVVDSNKYITDVSTATDSLWKMIKAAIDETVGSLGASVTPHYAFTPLFVHTDLAKGNEDLLTEYPRDGVSDKFIPDFTKPQTLPSIRSMYAGSCHVTWVVSDFIAKSPIRTSFTEGYARWKYTEELMPASLSSMTFSDLVKYTERLKYGDEALADFWGDESDESDESAESDGGEYEYEESVAEGSAIGDESDDLETVII